MEELTVDKGYFWRMKGNEEGFQGLYYTVLNLFPL